MVLGVKAPIVVLALFVLLLSTFSVVVPVGAQEIQWIKQYGTIDSDFPCGVSADQSGVYVAGTVEDQPLPGQTSAGKTDIFVRKYDFDGNEKWTRQFGSSEDDECGGISAFSSDVSADASGVYVTGATSGTLPAQRMSGIQDAFVRKYDFDGNVVWTKQFGVSNARTRSNGISVHLSGVYIAGDTTGNLGGQNPSPGSLNPFVRKHDFDGNQLWTQSFGTSGSDVGFRISARALDAYVVGTTTGAFAGYEHLGRTDIFLAKLAGIRTDLPFDYKIVLSSSRGTVLQS